MSHLILNIEHLKQIPIYIIFIWTMFNSFEKVLFTKWFYSSNHTENMYHSHPTTGFSDKRTNFYSGNFRQTRCRWLNPMQHISLPYMYQGDSGYLQDYRHHTTYLWTKQISSELIKNITLLGVYYYNKAECITMHKLNDCQFPHWKKYNQ